MPGAASLVLAWLANLINNVSSLDVICGPPVVQVKAARCGRLGVYPSAAGTPSSLE